MTTRSYALRAAAATAASLGLALSAAPAFAANSSGGAGLDSTTTTSASSPTPSSASSLQASPIGGPVSADGNGITFTTTAVGTYRQTLAFSGTAGSSDANDELAVQRQTAGGAWKTVAEAPVAGNGDFTVDWKPNTSGVVAFRAAIEAPAGAASAASATPESSSPSLNVTIYRDSIATIYGPGFYGHKTACGQILRPSTVGVASRTLKCGTEVSIDYNGQTITVPVIDQGPFANNANWDITEAAAQALGDPGTETVGAAAL